jgi:DNA-binding transcriptional ArsR family regulator
MEPRVEVGEGTAFEVLLGAAAIADDNWRDVFALGTSAYANALAAAGPAFVEQMAALGRFGWINLTSLLITSAHHWDLEHLIAAVRGCEPAELHYIAVGGLRRQLVQAVPEAVIRAALAGDTNARERLSAAFGSDELVLQATPWLMSSSSPDVRRVILDVLLIWEAQLLSPTAEAALSTVLHEHAVAARAELAKSTGSSFLAKITGGVRYEPAGLDRVIAVPSLHVSPVIVVIDGLNQHVILYPPRDPAPAADASRRLLELSRAVGDKTRVTILSELRQGERTAVDLAGALRVPRTTLLHHLALLRSAGLIHVTVTPGDATVYRLRPDGLHELSRLAATFMATE